MFKPLFLLPLCAIALVLTPQMTKAESFTTEQKTEIEALVKEYILNNGDVVLEALEKNQIAQQEKQLEAAKKNILDNADYLYNSNSPTIGPADADVTVVEFFDYNCGYCKKALEELQKVLDEDSNIKVIFKEMPILSEGSREAAKWSLAANKQDKYFEYHTALMNHRGAKNEAAFKKIATDLGLDLAQLEKDKESKDVIATIDKNLEMSGKLGIRGTPAFIIGEEFSPGYIPAPQMKAIISKVRSSDG
ncbi:MAG: DsbA family protein [Pseudomonadota bacterium]